MDQMYMVDQLQRGFMSYNSSNKKDDNGWRGSALTGSWSGSEADLLSLHEHNIDMLLSCLGYGNAKRVQHPRDVFIPSTMNARHLTRP